MHNQDLGRVAVVARGAYDPAAEYERLDAVSFNGSSYLVRKHCQGVKPEEGEYYMLMAQAGDSTAANAAAVEALAAAERADTATGRANTAAGNADEKAAAAGAAADSANAAAGNANTAAAGASSAKEAAETAASGANAAAESANQNAAAAETAANAANASAGRADQAAAGANAAREEAAAAAANANDAAAAAQSVVDTIELDMNQVKQTLATHGEALDNRIKKFYTGNLGAVNIADSDDGAVRNLVIGGRSEQLRTNGYQLLDPNVFQDVSEYNGRKIINNKDGSFTAVISADANASDVTNLMPPNNTFYDISPGTTYRYSGIMNGCGIAFALYDKDHNFSRYAGSTSYDGIFVTEDDEVFIRLYVQSSSTAEGTYTIWPMLEKGDTAHAWEPYTGGAPSPSPEYPQEIKSVENCSMIVSNADGTETQAAPIPVTLRGIGDVRDELYVYADGSGKLVQRIAKLKLADAEFNEANIKPVGENYRTQLVNTKDAGYDKSKGSDICSFLPHKAEYTLDIPHFYCSGGSSIYIFTPFGTKTEIIENYGNEYIIYVLANPIETALTAEQVKALFDLRTYYGGTNISYQSENGVEPVVNFDYACALENFVEYIKAAQGDDRKFIYDMDERMTDAEYVAALAYVNSEYATALTELEV